MKKALFILIFSALSSITLAQSYADQAAEIQKSVWGDNSPEFSLKDVPAKYANESAVILARSYKKQRSSATKFKFALIGVGVAQRLTTISTLHERVKINDKSALEAFSTLEYQKTLDNSSRLFTAKVWDLHETFVGAKIIKPDGKETMINTGEEVLLKDAGNDKRGKLAIPGLQVGDILDYYISANDLTEKAMEDSYKKNDEIFLLVNEYPVLNYSLDFQLSKKLDIQFLSANGAPDLVEEQPTKDDRVFSLRLKNLPKYEGTIWTSLYRQYPYIEISNQYTTSYGSFSRKRDETASRFVSLKQHFEALFNEQLVTGYDAPEKKLKELFNGRKGLKNESVDTVMKALYNIWKYNVFCSYHGVSSDDLTTLNYRTANSMVNAVYTGLLLSNMKYDYDILLVSSRNSSTLENAFNNNDIDFIIRVGGGAQPIYFSFYDGVTHFNEIPVQFQGENAIVLIPTRKSSVKYTFDENTAVVPATKANENLQAEKLNVSLAGDNMQKLKIDRQVTLTGYLRHDTQKFLLSPGEIDNTYTNSIKGDPIEKRLTRDAETKKMADAIISNMGKSEEQIKKDYTQEVKDQYEQEPKQISNYKIINTGLDDMAPFEYTSSFVLDNMVKKAGNNYIIDAGKLTGSFLKLEDKDRKRTTDVYMPCARSFSYTININIPKGYNVKGIEDLNKQKTNKTGSFVSKAVLNGSVLNITVTRTYNNAFEKAADWQLVTDIIDAASAFNNQKILLEKAG